MTQITNPVQLDRLDPYLIDVYDLKKRFDKPKTFDVKKKGSTVMTLHILFTQSSRHGLVPVPVEVSTTCITLLIIDECHIQKRRRKRRAN